MQKGFESVEELNDFKLKNKSFVKKDVLLSGAEAVALGAIAGGCNFISSYYGDGLVRVDSDEHDEDGCITEDLNLRTKMVKKRLKKLKAIIKEIEKPEIIGASDYKILIIGWGSTKNTIKEALKETKRKDIAFLHS